MYAAGRSETGTEVPAPTVVDLAAAPVGPADAPGSAAAAGGAAAGGAAAAVARGPAGHQAV